MKVINGGVCAPKGFKANGIHAGIRYNKSKLDLSLIKSDVIASAAAVYTTNLVKGAPIYVTKANINDGKAIAMLCNSGNANTCNADGIEISTKCCEILAENLGINSNDVIVASTGVIGLPMSIKPFETGIPLIIKDLGNTEEHATKACLGIMTTDTKVKQIAIEFELGGKTAHLGAMTKGSGMISPQMATMLCFVTTDANIAPVMLDKALHEVADDSFNMLSVDGDTSTNDMLSIMANGLCGNELIISADDEYNKFKDALLFACKELSKQMAKDGEGATKLLVCKVNGAKTDNDARLVAKSVIKSSLLKSAMFGADANWGRVLCAIGYSKANVDIEKVSMSFSSKKGEVKVCEKGSGIPFSEEIAKKVLLEDEIDINIELNDGFSYSEGYGCDLTYDYVKINGDYRS